MTESERIEAHYRHQLARLGEMLEAAIAREQAQKTLIEAALVKIEHLRRKMNQQLIERGQPPVH